MKKIVAMLLVLILIFTVQINPKARVSQGGAPSIGDLGIDGISMLSQYGLKPDEIKSMGFKTVFLDAPGVRITKKPYRTDNKALKYLKENISELGKSQTDFYICINSGPGLSSDGKTTSLFKNKGEALYFSQMVKEIIKRYRDNSYFKGVSIDVNSPDVPEDKYYETMNYIADNVEKDYDVKFIYNLHPLTFEENLKNLPEITQKNVILNLTIGLKGLSYPGVGAGYRTSYNINKNAILSKLEGFKEYTDKNKLNAMITLKTPWVDNSQVLMQDMYETLKIVDYDYNICYGNSGDMYDFTMNDSVVKVIKRHSK